jgi:CheY-like chemotaxis protein
MVENQGRIYLQRPAGGGACFVIELPVNHGDGEIGAASPERSVLPVASAPRLRLQALVLDDEKMIAELLGATLKILGCTAVCCQSPLRALELVRQQKFDVILSDIRMPELNGNQFYAAVRELDPGQARRIVFLTGDTVNEETRQFFDSIPNAHLGKPFQREALQEILASVAAMGPIEPAVRAEV